ncbi:unnamed protein product, partial [Closterium sp. Yama58-4]
MQAEFQAHYACHMPMTEGMQGWARTLCGADINVPKDKVDKAQAYIIHELLDAETSFWPNDGLVERSMAHAMEFTEKGELSGLHLVLELDKERSARFTHSMHK